MPNWRQFLDEIKKEPKDMRSVCAEHMALTIVGEKTKLEWYVCPDCLRAHSEEDLRKEVAEQDEEFWLEDQEL